MNQLSKDCTKKQRAMPLEQNNGPSRTGYVYVLSNPSMPGILKIGYSKHGGQGRADIFYRNDTGVALPFQIEFEIFVNNARKLENLVHKELFHCRINDSREFFKCPVHEAQNTILTLLGRQDKLLPKTAPSFVELDFADGGTFHMLSSIEEYAKLKITACEYAKAIERMTWNADLIVDHVKRNRETDRLLSEKFRNQPIDEDLAVWSSDNE